MFESLIVATPLWRKCEDETHIPEIGTWESSETPETSEFDCRGQNTLHCSIFYVIRKLLKCRCRKWPCMGHLDICSTSYGKKKGRECRNPTLAKCGGEAQHLEKLEVWSPPGLLNVQSSTERPKTPHIGVFLVSLDRSWNVHIENGLALAIPTSAAQVMGKRRAGSQTGSLTPDH